MRYVEIVLMILGAVSIVMFLGKLIFALIMRKFQLSGAELVRFLRTGEHCIAIDKCPLCGYDAAQIIELPEGKVKVQCSMCGCSTAEFDSIEEAMIAWDLRDGQPTEQWQFCGEDNK